jgi:hypothetical protein
MAEEAEAPYIDVPQAKLCARCVWLKTNGNEAARKVVSALVPPAAEVAEGHEELTGPGLVFIIQFERDGVRIRNLQLYNESIQAW